MKKIIIVLLFIVPLVAMKANAQYAVTLYNSSTNPVSFSLSYDDINYADYPLAASKLQKFNLGTNITCWIKLETKSNGPMSVSGVVKYQLNAGKKYQIYWNINTMKWDLAEYK